MMGETLRETLSETLSESESSEVGIGWLRLGVGEELGLGTADSRLGILFVDWDL